MCLVLLLSKWLVRAHSHVLFLFRGPTWLIITAHRPTSLSWDFFLLHTLTKWASNGTPISIVNHGLSMRFWRNAKLVLIPAVGSILRNNGLLAHWLHEVVVLGDDALVDRSLLLLELRLAVICLRLHIFANNLVLGELFLWGLVTILVPVECAVVRVQAHAHVVQWDLRLMKDFVVLCWSGKVYSFFLLDLAARCLVL